MVKVKDTLTQAAIARAERHAALKARPCKHCGQPIGTLDKRQVKCGLNCPAFVKVKVKCIVCGTEVERYEKSLKMHGGACCSLTCQRKHSLENNRGVGNRSGRKKIPGKVKENWIKSTSTNRRKCSIEYKFFQIAACFEREDKVHVDKWEERCRSARSVLLQRMTFDKGETKSTSTSFDEVVRKCFTGYAALEGRVWEKKCYSTVKNMKWKRRLRNVKRNFSPLTESTKQQPKQLSLWG